MADKPKQKEVLFAKPDSQAFKAHLLQKKRKKRRNNVFSMVWSFLTDYAGMTFTRNSPQTFTDFEGLVKTVPAGVSAHVGARMVENLSSGVTTQSVTVAIGQEYAVTIKGDNAATAVLSNAATGTLTADGVNRISHNNGTPITATTTTLTIIVTGTLTQLQVEKVTGQANQNPSEFVDGVEFFLTENGNTVDGNGVVTEGPQTVLGTIYVDNRATGANNGTSPEDAYTSIAAITSVSAGAVVSFARGSGPYRELFDLTGNGASGNPVVWECNGVTISAAEDLNNGLYQWVASGSGTNEYYLELLGGGNPGLAEVKSATVNGYYRGSSAETSRQRGTIGTLVDLNWAWGNNDSLGFNTFYIRSDLANPSTLDIEASQRNYCLDTNWVYHKIRNPRFLYGNVSSVRPRGEGWIFENPLFAFADFNGVQASQAGKTTIIKNPLFFWSGHRAVSQEADNTVEVYGGVDYGAHIFALQAANLTSAATLKLRNCISANGEAGAIDKKSASAVLDENGCHWYPRMTASGGALSYINPANWTTTGVNDSPASAATTESNQANLVNPLFNFVDDNDLDACDFHLRHDSPARGAGLDVFTDNATDYDGLNWNTSPSKGVYALPAITGAAGILLDPAASTSLVQGLSIPKNGVSGHVKLRPQFNGTDEKPSFYPLFVIWADGVDYMDVVVNPTDSRLYMRKKNGVPRPEIQLATSYLANDLLNIRWRYSSAGMKIWVNEVSGEDNSAEAQSGISIEPSQLSFATTGHSTTTTLLKVVVESCKIWSEAKSDAFLESLT